jgi:hypothetical protein
VRGTAGAASLFIVVGFTGLYGLGSGFCTPLGIERFEPGAAFPVGFYETPHFQRFSLGFCRRGKGFRAVRLVFRRLARS